MPYNVPESSGILNQNFSKLETTESKISQLKMESDGSKIVLQGLDNSQTKRESIIQ